MKQIARTRQDAIRRGERVYFTQKLCKHGHRALRSVRRAECLECHRIDKRASKRRHPENERARQKRWRENNPEKAKAYQYAYWHDPANAEKNHARTRVKVAKRNGILVPVPCKCGRLDVQAHHEDYSKPLEVIWLCPSCHAVTDRQRT